MLIESLKIFCDLAGLKSFSRTAEANYVTQPAVSTQIKKLEKLWKLKLFDRQRKSVQLTPAGEVLYEKAKEILDIYEQLNLSMRGMTQSVSGSVRIAAIHGVGLHELPPYMKQFMKLYPQVNMGLEYMQDNLVYEQVANGRADLGVVAFPAARATVDVIPFREDELVLACHPGHAFARYRKIPLAKIKGAAYVAFKKGLPTRKVVDQFLEKQGTPVRVAMEFDNIETLKRAIEIDAGISILPLVSIQQEIERGTLKPVRIAGKRLARTLGILVKKNKTLSDPVNKFIRVLQSSSR